MQFVRSLSVLTMRAICISPMLRPTVNHDMTSDVYYAPYQVGWVTNTKKTSTLMQARTPRDSGDQPWQTSGSCTPNASWHTDKPPTLMRAGPSPCNPNLIRCFWLLTHLPWLLSHAHQNLYCAARLLPRNCKGSKVHNLQLINLDSRTVNPKQQPRGFQTV